MSQATSAGRMRRYAKGLVAGVGLAGLMLTASSATLDTLEVSRSKGRYELRAETFLAAPAEEIYNVLLEYEDNKFRRISSVYKQSGYLDPEPDGTPLVYTRMEGCILFFCMDMKRVERLSTESGR